MVFSSYRYLLCFMHIYFDFNSLYIVFYHFPRSSSAGIGFTQERKLAKMGKRLAVWGTPVNSIHRITKIAYCRSVDKYALFVDPVSIVLSSFSLVCVCFSL